LNTNIRRIQDSTGRILGVVGSLVVTVLKRQLTAGESNLSKFYLASCYLSATILMQKEK